MTFSIPRPRPRTLGGLLAALTLCSLLAASPARAAVPRVGVLVTAVPLERQGPETRAAALLAGKLASPTVLRPAGGAKFVDADGEAVSLPDLPVLWYHQGDENTASGPMYAPKTLAALKDYVRKGGGLFLSGAALGMVHDLGIEPVNPRRGGPGNDASPAALVPVAGNHPVFAGLGAKGSRVDLSDRGFPAFADFHGSGGPGGGMLLARSPGASENPLAEYQLGKGRVIVMGWRLPHYAHSPNPYRANLERLTGNILAYLASPKGWQKVVVRPYKPARRQPKPTVAAKPAFSPEGVESLELAIRDLMATFPDRYTKGADYLARLADLKKHLAPAGKDALAAPSPEELAKQLDALRREALLANPLLDFEKLLLVKRSARNLALPANWQSNSSLRTTGHDNEICTLSPVSPEGKLTTLYKPEKGQFVGDVDLHWDATRMLLSMPGKNGRWQVHELGVDGKGPRELPLITQADADNYDACYLPDGNVIFTSTAPCVGVPCVKGSSHVSVLFLYEPASGRIRQLSFDQDHNWCPTVLPSGRVLYLRWEYSDIPHFVSRILFHMNPDGTDQKEFYGSNSYWPNSMFYARPIPGEPTKFVAVISGHHDTHRMGELILFDTAKGRQEAKGALQRIPGRGKVVEPVILDGLVGRSWPKYLHPWPLSGKYFLVACQPNARAAWGLYLADVFDNLVPILEVPGYALLEPIPLVPRPAPPVIPSKVDLARKDGVLYVADIYAGPGLAGVPRGTVKKLRLFTYHFAYHGMGGQVNRVGLDGPWDIKRVLGTVPVEADGSAMFRVPANTPVSIQPLDAEGKALQLMRSWTTTMPGEVQSCVGCHETQNTPVPNIRTIASSKPAAEITPFHGPVRGFGFPREVQPVLDRHCISCHDGKPRKDRPAIPNFTARPPVPANIPKNGYRGGSTFTPSYIALRGFVRTPSIESDMHMLTPMDFHADTTKLVQLLRRGHHGVKLDAESWERIITWIDLGAPAHGTWSEIVGESLAFKMRDRRREIWKLYAGRDEDPEAILPVKPVPAPVEAPKPEPIVPRTSTVANPPGWPFDPAAAQRRQAAGAEAVTQSIDLGKGVKLELVRVPAGAFVMGQADGLAEERPPAVVRIAKPFWIGKFEVTNAQFACFDASHDSRLEHGDFLQFGVRERGYDLNAPAQPVVRVSWRAAESFCRWLAKRSGRPFALPTEAQWEWACRAGTQTPLSYGPVDADFAKYANLADLSLRRMPTYGWGLPSGAVPPWRPAVESVNDAQRVSAPVGSYQPNAWGLCDMHGNVAEWTRSLYRPYPYKDDDGRNDPRAPGRRVARGGSWNERPRHARSASRAPFWPYQPVFCVGFRVICEDDAVRKIAAGK